YSAVPLELTLGDGSTYRINDPSSGGTATTSMNVFLDNTGHYSQVMAGDGLSVTGSGTIDGNTFDRTLVPAQVQAFTLPAPQVADAEFAVQLTVAGGLLAQQPAGQLQVGGDVTLLMPHPGLTISSFPQTFSLDPGLGTSDLTGSGGSTGEQPPATSGGCACGNDSAGLSVTAGSPSSGTFGTSNETGHYTVYPYDGSFKYP